MSSIRIFGLEKIFGKKLLSLPLCVKCWRWKSTAFYKALRFEIEEENRVEDFAVVCGLIDHFFSITCINDCTIPINSSFDLSVKV